MNFNFTYNIYFPKIPFKKRAIIILVNPSSKFKRKKNLRLNPLENSHACVGSV